MLRFGSLFSGCWSLPQVKCSQLHVQTWNRWIFSFDIDKVIIMLESYNQHLSAPISHDRITKALSRATMSSRNVDGLNAHQTKTHTYTGSNGRTNCELEILYYNVWIILPKHDKWQMFKECAMKCNAQHEYWCFGKPRLWQSQNNTFSKEFCPEKEVGFDEY